MRAHVKKQHPDVELSTGFSRNLTERLADPRSVIGQTGESCWCKYYNFVSFLIINGKKSKRENKFIEKYR